MKVAVTTIMKNEPAEFIERWVKSARDADYLQLTDTGSTNNSVETARVWGIHVPEVYISPWRFDVARNAGLALIPKDIDIVITLDVDEVLSEGWRDALEEASGAGAHQYHYDYIWNWKPNGEPDVQFQGERCHTRHGWMWKHPVHETLVQTTDPKLGLRQFKADFAIHHHADEGKPRTSYLPLLEQAIEESPHDDRMAHYYARELFFRGQWDRARKEFLRHLEMPNAVWAPERANSYRYLAKMDDYPERWLLKAVAEAPNRREAWVDLADFYVKHGEITAAAGAAARALRIIQRPGDYMSESHAWDDAYLNGLVQS